jgi:CRISPR-associated protein Csb1
MHHKIRLESLLPTFVPTGFPDLGPSTVRDARDGKTLLIVDSVQSIANHLEATIVAKPGQVIDGLETMPYGRLRITDSHGRTQSSSSLELPHRLASGWFCRSGELKSFQEELTQRILKDGIAAATFYYCPNSLLHGVFYSQLSSLDATVHITKSPRLLTAEIVARGAHPIKDGGMARDPLTINGKEFDLETAFPKRDKESESAKENPASRVGLGFILFPHYAYVAEEIELAVYLAQGRIDRLPLPEPARQVLALLARLKLARLLAEPLDLRAHCIFTASEVPKELADPAGLLTALQEQLEACRQLGLLAEPAVTEFALSLAAAKEKPKKAKAGAAVAPTEAEAGAAGAQEEEPG